MLRLKKDLNVYDVVWNNITQKNDEILLGAQIIAVADIVESMSSHRPYRPARGLDAAFEEISRQRGAQLNSQVVDSCLRLFKEKNFSI